MKPTREQRLESMLRLLVSRIWIRGKNNEHITFTPGAKWVVLRAKQFVEDLNNAEKKERELSSDRE